MKLTRILPMLLIPMTIAACDMPKYVDPCLKPCPETIEPWRCDCKPHKGGGSFKPMTVDAPDVKSEPVKPDVKPEPDPKHEGGGKGHGHDKGHGKHH